MRKRFKKWLRRHPVITGLAGFLFIALPPWAISVWSAFSSEPFFRFLARQRIPIHLGFSIQWITIPIGLTLLGLVVWALWSKKQPPALRQNIGRLRGRILLLALGESEKGTLITIKLQLTNTGSPTIADAWCITFLVDESLQGFPAIHFPPGKLTFPDGRGGTFSIRPSEMIYEKLTVPVPEGGRVTGFLCFLAKDISFSRLSAEPLPKFTVHFRDVDGVEYQVTTGEVGTPMYEAGVDDPFLTVTSTLSTPILFPESLREKIAGERVTYEETDQIIEIFKNAPQVKVAITSLSARAGEEFRPVMEQAGWLHQALIKAGVSTTISLWETLGSVPDGTSVWWIKNGPNNDMVERIVRAAEIKGLHPREVQRSVSAGDSQIELMIGKNPKRPS